MVLRGLGLMIFDSLLKGCLDLIGYLFLCDKRLGLMIKIDS